MAAALALAARIAVAGAFAVAALQKLRAGASLRAQLDAFGVPGAFVGITGVVLPCAELATAVALLAFAYSPVPGFVAIALLALFTGAVMANLSRGRQVPCPCFGAATDSPISTHTIVRNGWLLGLAVLATGSIEGAEPVAAAALAIALVAATAGLLRALG